MEDKVEGTCENKKSEAQADSWSVTENSMWKCEKDIANQKANHMQVLDKNDVFEMYLFAMWYKWLLFTIRTKYGESEDEKLEGVKLYEWKVCIYKQNSQNFVTNMRKMRLLELLSYIFIVNLSTYKSDIETFSHLTLTWFLLDL